MDIVKEPSTEEEILEVVSKNVDKEVILEDIKNKGDHCVDHLCGCN